MVAEGIDYAALGRAVRASLGTATADHGVEIANLVSPQGLSLPKAAAQQLKWSAKSVKFTSQASVDALHDAFFVLLAYDEWARALQIARRISTIPLGAFGPYAPLRDILYGAAWYAARHGQPKIADELSRAGNQPPGYRPLYIEGGPQHRPLDDPTERAIAGLDSERLGDATSVNSRPFAFLSALGQLSTMWGSGGSDAWPLERLEFERERHEAAMKELPGMEPL